MVVFSAGNIERDDLINILSQGAKYPDYLNQAPVRHPSDALSVFSVGSCTRYSKNGSLAPSDAPSPFTRFGTEFRALKDSPKPEIVEHGGNICYQNGCWNSDGLGIKTFSNKGDIVEQLGTSFSTPVVSLQLARLWHFFDGVKNSETIKAILLSTCNLTSNHSRYVGAGVPSEDELFVSKKGVVRLIFEGILPLFDPSKEDYIPADEVKVFVPAEIETIEVFLVHSDNYERNLFPRLNTRLDIITEKPGARDPVKPDNITPRFHAHIKHLTFHYQQNIKGDWFFRIVPRGLGIPVEEREHTLVRYGGVIKMTAKKPTVGLRNSVLQGFQRGGAKIQIAN